MSLEGFYISSIVMVTATSTPRRQHLLVAFLLLGYPCRNLNKYHALHTFSKNTLITSHQTPPSQPLETLHKQLNAFHSGEKMHTPVYAIVVFIHKHISSITKLVGNSLGKINGTYANFYWVQTTEFCLSFILLSNCGQLLLIYMSANTDFIDIPIVIFAY